MLQEKFTDSAAPEQGKMRTRSGIRLHTLRFEAAFPCRVSQSSMQCPTLSFDQCGGSMRIALVIFVDGKGAAAPQVDIDHFEPAPGIPVRYVAVAQRPAIAPNTRFAQTRSAARGEFW